MIPILLLHPVPQPRGANFQLEQHDTMTRSSRKLNSNGYNSAQVSPSIVVIIIVLTIIFFLSAFLHLLIRWLARNPRGVGRGSNSRSIVTLTALQGQLQQLFHMHDSGIEQALIDALPVFVYKSVMPGLKEGADCAICLCEFQTDDHLRLLPSCSHAFHMDCIDTWLLSHSTCPLCRSALQPECWMQNVPSSTSPTTIEDDDGGPGDGAVLDNSSRRRSSSNSMMMMTIRSAPHDRGTCEENHAASRRSLNSQLADDGRPCAEDYCVGLNAVEPGCHSQRSVGNISIAFTEGGAALSVNEELSERTSSTLGSGRRVSVQLGKCRLIKPGQHPPSSNKGGASRRSYSKGSYEYVVNPLSVEIVVPTNVSYNKVLATSRRIDLGHRATASAECLEAPVTDPHRCNSPPYGENMSSCWVSASFRRLRNADEKAESSAKVDQSAHWITLDLTNSSTGTSMRGNVGSDVVMSPETNDSNKLDAGTCKVDHQKTPSKRAVSFRLPTPAGSMVAKLRASGSRRALSENEAFSFWESCSDLALDDGQLTLTMDNTVEHRSSSFARRTMDWIVGWQRRTVHPHDISCSEVDLPHI